ncbi:MAG: N-acetylmuramoyl-L-alanine amidase [Bacteroidaceae bacterium]|nr:N-acetylmuramoyl-L-alanine amidase [Bacteroidaceae bacterium]
MRRLIHIIIYIGIQLFIVPTSAMTEGGDFLVMLDAGHGGKDPGTVGSSSRNREKDIAYNITMEVGRLLKNNHPEIKVGYTRSTDVFIELGRRAEIANKAKADLFVSIHVNSLPKDAKHYAYGVQSYTLSLNSTGTNLAVEKRENSVIALEGEAAKKYNYNSSPESNIMFELMQDHDMKESVNFAKMAQDEMVHTGGRKDMGVRQANLAVLRLTYMPSVLLEVGFISTPEEERFLMSKDGQNLMAKSIYNAIAKYASQRTGKKAKLEKPSTTLVQTPDTATTNDTPATVAPTTANGEKRTVYKVQVLAGSTKLKSNDKQFKGLKCEMHEKGGRYTYTYGSATTMDEAKKLRKSILDKFPQAFIVTFEE